MQALWKVIVPEIRPGMISGFMLALTLSIDDFAVTVFTIGNSRSGDALYLYLC